MNSTRQKGEKEKAAELRRQAEKKLKSRVAVMKDVSGEDTKKLIHDLHTYQIELELQNEELRSAHLEIEKSQQKYVDLYDFAPIGYLTLDEKGMIREANLTATHQLGVARAKLINTTLYQHTHSEDNDQVYLHLMGVFKNRVQKTCYARLKENGGREIHFQLDSVPVENAGENPMCRTVITDITERKKFEDASRKSEEKYRNLIDHAGDAIVTVETDGMIVGFNRMAEKLYGYPRDEILGKSSFLLLAPDEKERLKRALGNFKENNKIMLEKPVEVKGVRRGGKEVLIESTTYAIEVEGKWLLTSFIRDITEKRAIEQKLLQAEKLKSLGELAGGVAHDFNNVLAAILGRAQLIKMDIEPPPEVEEKRKAVLELKENVEVIEQAAKDGAETVKRIQEFARRRDDDKDFNTLDVNEIINNALEFTRARWCGKALAKGIEYKIQKEPSPLPLVSGSAAELREVFTNLINNALDAMPQGGDIKIKTYRKGNYVAVTFADTGCGISKHIKGQIFDPFFTTKGVQSTGLGMSVSYGIINRHRGNIEVDSIEGQGTTFTIKLPIADKAIKEEKAEVIPEEQRKAKILVIEDEENVRKALAAILKRAGHEVEVVSSGNQGIALFEEKEFDLVFTDLGMPGISGWQVAEKIKARNGRIPVAVITGWNVELSESELKDKWVDLIIQKPFEVNQVLKLVQEGIILRDRLKVA